MKEIKLFDKLNIISYKHDGKLHKVWKDVYKIYEDDHKLILINNYVHVMDGSGRTWMTKEPAVCYFYKHYWFNVVCMIKNNDVYYYCNLSSPYVSDIEGIKYIDYDLDVKVFPNGDILELDRDEYIFNDKQFHYSNDIKNIINEHMNILIKKIKNKEEPFIKEEVIAWYNKFLENNI